jgi:hypothetical protein
LHVGTNISEEAASFIFRAEDFPPKRCYLPRSPHGVTTQKTNIDIFTAVRTSNLLQENFLKKLISLMIRKDNRKVKSHRHQKDT